MKSKKSDEESWQNERVVLASNFINFSFLSPKGLDCFALMCGQALEFYADPILTAPDDLTDDGQRLLVSRGCKGHDNFLTAEKGIAGFNEYPVVVDIQDVAIEPAAPDEIR